ncbi:hypothetical protein KSD_90850 [Ktedonobacter sp. SOSP1-85]|nr:hypothetical protein KSD_90850 [Ktedonobacter sp. SOSP1-85]
MQRASTNNLPEADQENFFYLAHISVWPTFRVIGTFEALSQHCQRVHEATVEQGKLDLVHVQADEIRVKDRKIVAWMG